VKLRNKAEQQGIDFTTQGYPRTYYTPGVIQRDLEEVRVAAEQGNIEAQFYMGTVYLDGLQGVKQDYTEALKWYQKAAEKGDISANFCVGMMHMNGQGVEKSKPEALKWLKKAAAQGDINAQSMVKNLSKPKVKQEQGAVKVEQPEQWQPSDGETIQVSNLVMALKRESGKYPTGHEMLTYIQNKVNLLPDQIKFILEEQGLADF
jgi:TPR repeat protein